jgi:hypothetical protein
MDYSKLNDFDINRLIAIYEGVRGFHCENVGGGSALKFSNWKELDYCNNPADAWPIITSNRIALSPLFGGEWRASVDDECGFISYTCSTENPLRAAMTVFLMAQESANVPANSTGSDLL